MLQKKPSDIMGVKINCPMYIKCALCFGCRNYNASLLQCGICLNNGRKRNICNTDLHKPDLVAKIISRNSLDIKEEIKFE